MTHESDSDLLNHVLQLVSENGSEAFLECFRLLLNEAMRHERSHALGAKPYERSDSHRGHSNSFKPKSILTRMGSVDLQIPQIRGDVDFYPKALEKCLRSEQAIS